MTQPFSFPHGKLLLIGNNGFEAIIIDFKDKKKFKYKSKC